MRKVLRSGAIYFEYAREVQPLPKLGPWRADLDRMLATNKAKSGRERLTLIRLFEELRGLGYEGGYDAVEQRNPFAPAPLQSLRRYYGLLRPCAPLRYSRPRGWSRLRLVPSRRRRDEAQVLTFYTKAWSSFAPPTCRMPLGHYQGIPEPDTPQFVGS